MVKQLPAEENEQLTLGKFPEGKSPSRKEEGRKPQLLASGCLIQAHWGAGPARRALTHPGESQLTYEFFN